MLRFPRRCRRMMFLELDRRNGVKDLRVGIPIFNAPAQFFVLASQRADLLAKLVILHPKLLLFVKTPRMASLAPFTQIRKRQRNKKARDHQACGKGKYERYDPLKKSRVKHILHLL